MLRTVPVRVAVAGATALTLAVAWPAGAATNSFKVTMRVTDKTGAPSVDKDLVNPWGMSQSPNSPVWVSDNGSNKTTLYETTTPNPKVPLTVTIPGGAPTGQVFNSSTGFAVGGEPATFIFDSEAGVLSAWNSGTAAVKEKTVKDAVFKGLAMATVKGSSFLYAADFHHGKVMEFNSSWKHVATTNKFVDPKLPGGYAPFNVAELKGKLYVAYAKQDSDRHDDVAGAGHGFVDVYTNGGNFVKRLVSRGALNSPWGMVIAPKGFGPFGGDLLVGNFGNGRINAYNATTGAHKGVLKNAKGNPITLPGLWGLLFGNGTSAPTSDLMFTSGPGHEAHGRWGTIAAS